MYLKGSKIFLGILNFDSKMSDRIKFQKHVPLNYIISLELDLVYFVYCKEYQTSNQVSLNPVVSLTFTIRKMMQFGTTTETEDAEDVIDNEVESGSEGGDYKYTSIE